MYLPFGALFRKIWYSDTKFPPKLHKLGVLNGIPMGGGIWQQKWYRESQIFEVRQAHSRTILVKATPSPDIRNLLYGVKMKVICTGIQLFWSCQFVHLFEGCPNLGTIT